MAFPPAVQAVSVVAVMLGLVLYATIWMLSHSPRSPYSSELMYVGVSGDGTRTSPESLPTITDAPEVALSVVIPCYNERKRLPGMLTEAIPWLRRQYHRSWELLLVDDGSSDGTADVALDFAAKQGLGPGNLRVCRLKQNRGKGGAVTHGMLHARGELVLFADADGASEFSDTEKLVDAVRRLAPKSTDAAVAVGSRAHLVTSDAVVKRSPLRNFLMYGLHTLVYVFGIRSVADTQCGFKLFTRPAVQAIFPKMHTERWIFDVEAILLAMRQNIPVQEVPISWHEVAGSKIDLARDSVLMAVDLVVIRFAYLLGIYTITPSKHFKKIQ